MLPAPPATMYMGALGLLRPAGSAVLLFAGANRWLLCTWPKMARSTPYLYSSGSNAAWHEAHELSSPVEYQGRCPPTTTQGVTVRSTDARSAARKSSCWLV